MNEDLKNIWDELLNDNNEGNFYIYRTISIKPLEIRIKIEKPLDKYGIQILSEHSGFSSDDILTNNKYFKVSEISLDQKKTLAIDLIDNVFVDEFILFSKIILEITQSSTSSQDAISTIAQKIKQFERFISSANKKFTFEKRMGLMGELYFMKNFLMPRFNIEECINSWKGPHNSSQDFIFPNFRFEIKTSSKENNSVKISSLNQLDPTQNNLFLVRNYISENNTLGISFSRMISSIDFRIKKVASDLSVQFHSLVRQYGYAIEDENEYSQYKYILSGRNFYNIDQDFPSINNENAPSSITHASYDLDLNQCSNWLLDEGSVVKKIIHEAA